MSIVMEWLVEGRVIVSYIWEEFTQEEIIDGGHRLQAFVDTCTPLMHDIIDMRYVRKHPISVGPIAQALPAFRDERMGWVILVSSSEIIRSLTRMILGVMRSRFRAFATPEEAIAFLQEVDASLPPIPLYDPERIVAAAE